MIDYKADFVYFRECIKLIDKGTEPIARFYISRQICSRVIDYINALVNIEKACVKYKAKEMTSEEFTERIIKIVNWVSSKNENTR